jgi:L-iditol 2-dehydrogenase
LAVKTLRLHGPGDLRLHDEAPPVPGSDEILIRVAAVGVCGSDLHWLREGGIGDAALAQPLVLGHEVVGIVADGPRSGERVVLDPAIPCGSCRLCQAGDGHLCRTMRFAGHGRTDGSLREFMAWPERLAHQLPDGVSDVEAALLEPLGVALHALHLARVEPGMSAGVYGCGPIGLLLVQLLRMQGVERIVATDRLAHRISAAAAMGASETGLVTREQPGVREATPDTEVTVAFEVAGDDGAVETAMRTVEPGGRVVLVGIPEGDRTTFTASMARRKGLTLQLCRRMRPEDLQRALQLAERQQLDLRSLVTHRYPLTSAVNGFAAAAERRGLKVVIEPAASHDSDRRGA